MPLGKCKGALTLRHLVTGHLLPITARRFPLFHVTSAASYFAACVRLVDHALIFQSALGGVEHDHTSRSLGRERP